MKIQANARGLAARKKYQSRLQYFRDHVPQIVRIQAAWKGLLARRQYKNLTKVRMACCVLSDVTLLFLL